MIKNSSYLRNRIIGASLIVIGTVGISGCVSPPKASTLAGIAAACPVQTDMSITGTINIAWQPIANTDVIVKDMQWLEACMPNATINWSKYSSGADVVQAFGSGSADVGIVGSGPAVKMLAEPLNLDVKIVWIDDVIGAAESLVGNKNLDSFNDLTGKKIAVPFGSTAHFSLLSALNESNISSADVQLINLQPDAMLAAWQRHEIDAAWIWDPTLSELKESGEVLLSSADTARLGRPTFDLSVATTEFINKNSSFMRMWTTLQSKAAERLKNNPEAAAESVALQLGVSPEEASKQIQGYVYLTAKEQSGPDYFGGSLERVLHENSIFLSKQGIIDYSGGEKLYEKAVESEFIEGLSK